MVKYLCILRVYLSVPAEVGKRSETLFCIWTWHMVLCSSLCWVEEKRISRLVDRQPLQRRGGSIWDCYQSSSNHLSTTHSGKTEPAITNNIFIWDTFPQRSTLTAALDTTVFWSHSIRTSKKVALFLSMAWRTFPKKARIMLMKFNWRCSKFNTLFLSLSYRYR